MPAATSASCFSTVLRLGTVAEPPSWLSSPRRALGGRDAAPPAADVWGTDCDAVRGRTTGKLRLSGVGSKGIQPYPGK